MTDYLIQKECDMNLYDFVIELENNVRQFKNHWLEQNAIDPEMFPMSFIDDDSGAWWEQFLAWYESNGGQ
jgi:hypothetical protein